MVATGRRLHARESPDASLLRGASVALPVPLDVRGPIPCLVPFVLDGDETSAEVAVAAHRDAHGFQIASMVPGHAPAEGLEGLGDERGRGVRMCTRGFPQRQTRPEGLNLRKLLPTPKEEMR